MSASATINTSELATYRRMFDDRYAEIDELLADLPAEALLWKPFESSPWKGTSGQLGWIIAHAMSSAIYLMRRAEWTMGKREWKEIEGDQGRDEFSQANHDPENMRQRAKLTHDLINQMLDNIAPADLDASRPHPKRPEMIFTARYDIIHAFEHFSQHIGHAQLTRQLWALAQN